MSRNFLKIDTPPILFRHGTTTPSSTNADSIINFEQRRISGGLVNSALLGARSTQLGEIGDLFKTRNYAGWDGYEAIPITVQSKDTAETILGMIPLEIDSPEIIPTAKGGYSIEWKDDTKYLVIEIEGKEVSCVLIDAEKRKKKSSFTERYEGDFEDFAKWIRDEFPLND